jgi:hypothetical protein
MNGGLEIMWKDKTVSIVFPVYNEEEGLLKAVEDFFGLE